MGPSAQRVLYLEDDAMLAHATMLLLQALGLTTIDHVTSIEDALIELREGDYDLCILDIRISGRLALEVIDQAKTLAVALILVSGDLLPATLDLNGVTWRFLQKPVELSAWRNTLQKLDEWA